MADRNVVAILKGTDKLVGLFDSWDRYDEFLDTTDQYTEDDLTVCSARVRGSE